MKCKIPAASKTFRGVKICKQPSIKNVVDEWLNSDVHEKIMAAIGEVSVGRIIKVKGLVSVAVPYEYYSNPKEFVLQTKAVLVPIGYDVEFGDNGTGAYTVCLITWEVTKGGK